MFAVLATYPRPPPAILLLRTIAIYSRSRLITIPLSIAYAVRPQGKLLGLCGSLYAQIGVVAGIVLTWYDLHTTFCE